MELMGYEIGGSPNPNPPQNNRASIPKRELRPSHSSPDLFDGADMWDDAPIPDDEPTMTSHHEGKGLGDLLKGLKKKKQ